MGVIEDTGMSDRDKMETMIEVSGIHTLPISGSKCSKTPGYLPVLAIYAQVAFACVPFNTIGISQYVIFRAPSLQGRHSPLPLFLARFPAYASTSMLPWRLQGWILCPWLAVTQVGFPPTGLNDIAEPQLKDDLTFVMLWIH